MIDYIKNNYSWLFSGLGLIPITIIIAVIGFFIKQKFFNDESKNIKMKQVIKGNAKGYQAGRDIKIKKDKD